jgi:RsiW-degrading membrane proteinase PrsW (M82 family)
MPWDLAVPIAAAGSSAAWARLAAVRAGVARGGATAVALLAGVASSGLALVAYDVAARLGLELRWDTVAAGGTGALLVAAAIGLVEEGAKLAGILLVVERGAARGAVLAAAVGVAAGFAALEALLTLHGEPPAPALARAAFGPVAHALLAVPLVAGVAARPAAGRPRGLALAGALLASAALHAAGDVGAAAPGAGRLAYAAALALPAGALFLAARRPRK